jgi:serine protease AprX
MRQATELRRRLPIGLLLLALLTTLSAATPGVARRAAEPRLYLHRGVIDARAEPALASAELAAVSPGLALVQFDGPLGAAQRAALEGLGLSVLDYIPDYAYLVRGDQAALRAAERLPGFYGRLSLRAADKLSPELLQAILSAKYDQPVQLTIWAWPGREQAMAAELAAAAIDPRQPLDAAAALRAAALPSVRWLEPRQKIMLLNDQARTIMGVDQVWQDVGLYGAGQVLAVADSGFDTGDTQHADFAGRIIATQVLSAGGDLADENGHGTHVAGSAVGAGVLSGADPAQQAYSGSFAGVAPEASLVVQAFETSSEGEVLGLSDDTYPIFAQAYSATARLHTNSWGGIGGIPIFQFEDVFGSYPVKSQRTDAFIWDHPDMTVFFAAGNAGDDGFCARDRWRHR